MSLNYFGEQHVDAYNPFIFILKENHANRKQKNKNIRKLIRKKGDRLSLVELGERERPTYQSGKRDSTNKPKSKQSVEH